jgi:hypothetical protein
MTENNGNTMDKRWKDHNENHTFNIFSGAHLWIANIHHTLPVPPARAYGALFTHAVRKRAASARRRGGWRQRRQRTTTTTMEKRRPIWKIFKMYIFSF